MKFKTFWDELDPAQKRVFAEKCGRKPDWLRQIANGHGFAGRKLLKAISEASGGIVKPDEINADDLEAVS